MPNNIDLGLAVIESVAKREGLNAVELEASEIAEICECSRIAIYHIIASAKKKIIRSRMARWVGN